MLCKEMNLNVKWYN